MEVSPAIALPREAAPVPWQRALRGGAPAFPADELGAGIYVHVPFCASICSFCAFDAVASRGKLHARYTAAVEREIGGAAERLGRRVFDSIHFGGGTPSLLEVEQLAAIVAALRRSFDVVPGSEIALEADPATVDRAKLEALRGAGFTRVHFGVQSFDATELKFLGRGHSPDDARRAVAASFAAGFADVGVDLIFGLPEQEEAAWRRNLDAALALGVAHLSCYGLSLEEGSVFGHRHAQGRLDLPPEEDRRDHLEVAMEKLGAAGFLQYEISNYARPGFHSRHNLKYWSRAEYLGLGAGAHGFIDGERSANRGEPEAYLTRVERGESPCASAARVTDVESREESVFLELRKVTGLALDRFARRHGMSFEEAFRPGLARVHDLGLLYRAGDRLCLTRAGMLLSDSVFDELINTP